MTAESQPAKVRLDKWLWAARFFKTRGIAKKAVEAGHVHYGGARVKASKEVAVGATLRIRQGADEKTVVVQGLSDKRGPAPVAQRLYEETPASAAARTANAAARRAQRPGTLAGRPDKRARRQIHRFKTEAGER